MERRGVGFFGDDVSPAQLAVLGYGGGVVSVFQWDATVGWVAADSLRRMRQQNLPLPHQLAFAAGVATPILLGVWLLGKVIKRK